jgi:hypothetical protein
MPGHPVVLPPEARSILAEYLVLPLGKRLRRRFMSPTLRAKAEEHLKTAKAMYREMDMGFYLAQADRVSAGGDP